MWNLRRPWSAQFVAKILAGRHPSRQLNSCVAGVAWLAVWGLEDGWWAKLGLWITTIDGGHDR